MESPFCPVDAIKNDADFRLIETFGSVPGQGVARRELHLARLTRSAQYFGIPLDASAFEAQLAAVSRHPAPLRCRLTLSPDGQLHMETAQMPQQARTWVFAIAEERLSSADIFLAHKTTRRDIYTAARSTLASGLDELVFLNERDELCEGTICNIALTTPQGETLTPPLASGCLPGVYRQSCLNQGSLTEAVLTLNDLAEARSITLMNALRGATDAIWAPDCGEFASFA